MTTTDLAPIKETPILEVASKLGLKVRSKRAMCFGGHDKRTPSLCFVPAKGIWKCFGCGKGGDGIALVMAVISCDFRTALEWFARECSVDVTARRSMHGYRVRDHRHAGLRPTPKAHPARPEDGSDFGPAPEVYGWLISKCGVVSQPRGLEYLGEHGITLDVASRFGVRELRDTQRALKRMIERWGADRVYASGLAWGAKGKPERLIWTSYALLFPFRVGGGVSYLQGRMFRGEPKYLNPRGVVKPLYNTDRLDGLTAGAVIHLCEGVPDTLALETKGLPAVGVLGASSFRAEWVDLFMRFDVVLLPDGDSGGETFRKMTAGLFSDRGKAVRVVRLPPGKDVAEVIADMGKRP